MDYFKLLQFFCIKYRITLPINEDENEIPEWQKSLTEEQYTAIKDILDDNAKLIGKSPSFDQEVFAIVKNCHEKRLKNLGYTPEEIEQCLPVCLKGEKFPTLKNLIQYNFLTNKKFSELEKQIPNLVLDITGELNTLKEKRSIVLRPSRLNLFLRNQLQGLIAVVKDQNEGKEEAVLSPSYLEKRGYIVAYGTCEDVKNIFQNDQQIINTEQVCVNKKSNFCVTFLHLTIQTSNFLNFKCLLELGANPALLDKQDNNLWHHLFDSGDAFFMKSIILLDHEKGFLNKNDMYKPNNMNERTPFYYAVRSNKLKEVDQFFREYFLKPLSLDEKLYGEITILGMARNHVNVETIQFLLDRGEDVNGCDEIGNTWLHRIILDEDVKNKEDIIEFLVKKGIKLNIKNKEGITPLYLAVCHKEKKVAKFLAMKGADLNIQNNNGDTVLHRAAFQGNKKLYDFFIEKGGDSNISNKHGKKPAELFETFHLEDEVEVIELFLG